MAQDTDDPQVVVIQGAELGEFLWWCKEAKSIRVMVDGGGLKVSADRQTWTVPFGEVQA